MFFSIGSFHNEQEVYVLGGLDFDAVVKVTEKALLRFRKAGIFKPFQRERLGWWAG